MLPGGGSAMMNPEGKHGGPFKNKAPAFPRAVCAACHVVAAAEDMVFSQYYPVLRAAEPKK